jgi:hypothetical protein
VAHVAIECTGDWVHLPCIVPRDTSHGVSPCLPVNASRLGSLQEIVTDVKGGLLFEPGNTSNLAEKVCWA